MKFNQELIKQLAEGKVAIEHNSDRDSYSLLSDVLSEALEKHVSVLGDTSYYFIDERNPNTWDASSYIPSNMEAVPLEDFVVKEKTISIPRSALKDIYEYVCYDYQLKINEIATKDPLSDMVEVSEEDILQAYKDAGKDIQKNWLAIYAPKPKVKVTKEIVRYINIYPNNKIGSVYLEELAASTNADSHAIAKGVKLTGTYEVEE